MLAPLAWSLSASDATGIEKVECSVSRLGSPPSYGACSGGAAAHRTRIRAPGIYAFAARATDLAGNITIARALTFTVGPGGRGAFAPIVRNSFRVAGAFTRFLSLSASNVPAGGRVALSCRGRGCAVRGRRYAARRGRVALLGALKGRRLRAGTRLVVRVDGPGGELKIVRFTMRRGRAPRKSVRCARPGDRLRACA